MKTFSIAMVLLVAVGLSTGCNGGQAGAPDKAKSQQPSSPPESAPAPQAAAQSGIESQCVEGAKECEGKALAEWLENEHPVNYSCPNSEAEALIKISLIHGSKLDVANVNAFRGPTNLWGAYVWNPPKYGESPDGSYHLRGERQFAAPNEADVTLELHPHGESRMEYFISARRSGASADMGTSAYLFMAQGTCIRIASKSTSGQ